MRRPPKPKPKASIIRAPKGFDKFNLTDEQKIQVQIIDWKRSAVRALLILAYVVLAHILGFLIIIGQSHFLIHESAWLIISFYGFIVNLVVYFFGCGAALKAVSYVWAPMKFRVGILAVVLALLINIGLFFVGIYSSAEYESGIPKLLTAFCNDQSAQRAGKYNYRYNEACSLKDTVKLCVTLMPLILPPVALGCVCWAVFAIFNAIQIVPKKLGKGRKVDPVWLEPYETYDFYVGRNIPMIPGYDEAFEDTENTTSLKKYGLGVDIEDDAGSDGPGTETDDDENLAAQKSTHASITKGKKLHLEQSKHGRPTH